MGQFASQHPVETVQTQGIEVLVSVGRESDHHRRKHDWRPLILVKPAPKGFARRYAWIKKTVATMETDRARGLYKLRKQTVEPVFGIIKQALGFRQFLLKGLEKTSLEWSLVTCAYTQETGRIAVKSQEPSLHHGFLTLTGAPGAQDASVRVKTSSPTDCQAGDAFVQRPAALLGRRFSLSGPPEFLP